MPQDLITDSLDFEAVSAGELDDDQPSVAASAHVSSSVLTPVEIIKAAYEIISHRVPQELVCS